MDDHQYNADALTQAWAKRKAKEHTYPPRDGMGDHPDRYAYPWLKKTIGDSRLLDFGCGFGRLAHLFPPDRYIGVDICQADIRLAKKENPDHEFRLIKPADELPEADVALLYTVAHHIHADLLPGLAERMSRAVVRVVIVERMQNGILRGKPKFPSFLRPPAFYADVFRRHGFKAQPPASVPYLADRPNLTGLVLSC